MKTYRLEDILKYAIEIEHQGQNFYEVTAQYAQSKEVKKLFIDLAKAELKHARLFEKLCKRYQRHPLLFTASPYLEDLLELAMIGMMFPDISEVRDSLRKKKDAIINVIKIAMGVELNTIFFYHQIQRNIGRTKAKEALQMITGEEEKHLQRLKKMRIKVDPHYKKKIKHTSLFSKKGAR